MILYQDHDFAVLNKPSGILVHRSQLDNAETQSLVTELKGQLNRVIHLVHRLDKSTSGALIVAFGKEVATNLATQFQNGEVKKEYLAVVRGVLDNEVCIDRPLPKLRAKGALKSDNPKLLPAVTRLVPISSCEIEVCVDKYPTSRYSLIQAFPETGRSHQIRRHSRSAGHPIIGDVNYGSGKHNRYFENRFGKRRLLLHSRSVEFTHPTKKTKMKVEAPLDDLMAVVVSELFKKSFD